MFFRNRDRRLIDERLTIMALNLTNLTNVLASLVTALQQQNASVQQLIAAHTDTAAQAQVDALTQTASQVADSVNTSTAQINAALAAS